MKECIAACIQYKATKTFGISRYAAGQKYCTECDIFVFWDGRYCPCCGIQLRTKPKGATEKRKYLEDMKN